jgi:hypothetical protein
MKSLTRRKPVEATVEPVLNPYPIGKNMPKGWKPDRAVLYVRMKESFYIGTRLFAEGWVVRGDDVMIPKLIYSTPAEWINITWKED